MQADAARGIGKTPPNMGTSATPLFMRRRHYIQRAHHEDPMSTMGNLFDVAILMGVGMLIMALSSYGLGGLLSKNDMTVVTNPGKPDQTVITRTNGDIKVLKQTGGTASGQGVPVGTIYRLSSGAYVWQPEAPKP